MNAEHKEHLIRTAMVLVLTIAVGAGVLFGADLGEAWRMRLEGALGLLLPVLLDSMRVAGRQRGQRRSLRPPAADVEDDDRDTPVEKPSSNPPR